jgi:hypothetical protein
MQFSGHAHCRWPSGCRVTPAEPGAVVDADGGIGGEGILDCLPVGGQAAHGGDDDDRERPGAGAPDVEPVAVYVDQAPRRWEPAAITGLSCQLVAGAGQRECGCDPTECGR